MIEIKLRRLKTGLQQTHNPWGKDRSFSKLKIEAGLNLGRVLHSICVSSLLNQSR